MCGACSPRSGEDKAKLEGMGNILSTYDFYIIVSEIHASSWKFVIDIHNFLYFPGMAVNANAVPGRGSPVISTVPQENSPAGVVEVVISA